MKLSYAIVFVSDMKRSVAFYRDVFGIALRFESPEWTEFATEGATLALHKGDRAALAAEGNPAGQCKPGLKVSDLDAFHKRMQDNRVPCLQAPKDVHGVRIAQY